MLSTRSQRQTTAPDVQRAEEGCGNAPQDALHRAKKLSTGAKNSEVARTEREGTCGNPERMRSLQG